MASVQRRDRTSSGHILAGQEERHSLWVLKKSVRFLVFWG
jgi:hypothetical protein